VNRPQHPDCPWAVHGIQEVSGSIPLISTSEITSPLLKRSGDFFAKKGAEKRPNRVSISQMKSPCPFSLSPTFYLHSYETSHLAKSGFRMYYEDTKKE